MTAHVAPARKRLLALRLLGAALLVVTGSIHLDLYLTGYRSIPTIGWMFALQVAAAYCLAIAIGCTRSRIAAASGATFALSTLGGYLLSVWIGLFGFKEVRTEAGVIAGSVEVAAVIVLLGYLVVASMLDGQAATHRMGGAGSGVRVGAVLVGLASAVTVALLGASVAIAAGPPPPMHNDRALLSARTIDGATVLTNAQGLTLYWFAPDTPTTSTCTGACTAYWPPVTGAPVLAAGLMGRTGTITRAGGVLQSTYQGHPLYTYIGDAGPGQANGNNLDLNGGLWYEMQAATQ
jgi:predicted lipoprotein with Yx(FWY)xxD motif